MTYYILWTVLYIYDSKEKIFDIAVGKIENKIIKRNTFLVSKLNKITISDKHTNLSDKSILFRRMFIIIIIHDVFSILSKIQVHSNTTSKRNSIYVENLFLKPR